MNSFVVAGRATHELLEKAECVIEIPSVRKLAFGVGASYGRGAMVCRTGEKFRGPWRVPAMYALKGGSLGLQIGGDGLDPAGQE
jgi:lipid-binding SYLF domain-containing protein